MKKIINWRTFAILLGLSFVSVICVFPYVLSIQGELLSQIPVSIAVLFGIQLIQSLILFSVAIFFGLVLIRKTGFELPLLEAQDKKSSIEFLKNNWLLSVSIGIGVAVVIYVLDLVFTKLGAGITTHANLAPIWQKLLAAVYGGITEEVLLRLFFMSLLVWLGMKLFRQEKPSGIIIWISIIIAAVIFGLGHLPITASVTNINATVVLRAVVLNGIAGVVFGWLFWKRGLESAIIAHFTADIFLLTLLPLFFR